MRDILQISKLLQKPNKSNNKNKVENNKDNKFLIYGFLIMVSIAGFYFYGIGRERYSVRSDVVVRKTGQDDSATLSLGTLLGGGNQSSLEDARYMRTYLESPQVLEDLQKEFNFKK